MQAHYPDLDAEAMVEAIHNPVPYSLINGNTQELETSFVPAPQPEIHSPQPTAAQAAVVSQAAPSGPVFRMQGMDLPLIRVD